MGVRVITVVVIFVLLLSVASAHAPQFREKNESLDTAQYVDNPTKSWVIYAELDHGTSAHYYRMELEKGERLQLGIIVPHNSEFSPNMVIMGDNIESNDTVPAYVTSSHTAEPWGFPIGNLRFTTHLFFRLEDTSRSIEQIG